MPVHKKGAGRVQANPSRLALPARPAMHAALTAAARADHHAQGDFLMVMDQLPGNYDLVFFDGFSPELRILRRLRRKLRDGGPFVCANLSFADEDSKAELNDLAKWRAAGSIEGGATRAFVNASATAHGGAAEGPARLPAR